MLRKNKKSEKGKSLPPPFLFSVKGISNLLSDYLVAEY